MGNNIYEGVLRFNGTFRPYQQRVLDRAGGYLKDGKLHIVAAPGSGKTTLGIELIRRIGRPALVISPRLVIRDQWLNRIREAFLQPDCEAALSSDLRRPGLITSITYQTLFSAVTRYKGSLQQEEEPEEESGKPPAETVDFSDFDLMRTVKRAGIQVLCLDECHHLRSEWWQALETFMKAMRDENVVTIALTATPPYDSTRGEWGRYTALCGSVDEEISVPELVAADCLCPHQDYVLFSLPTETEKAKLDAIDGAISAALHTLRTDAEFRRAVAAHTGLANYGKASEAMLETPEYLSSLLIFLNDTGQSFDPRWMTLLGAEQLPALTEEWLQILLQGFLYDDRDSYPGSEDCRVSVENYLKRAGLIQRRKVSLTDSETVKKLMASSLGKLDSIETIARTEYGGLGGSLRMLILADYIRAEHLSAVGTDEKITAMGVIPIFEALRRTLPEECRLAVLCGGMVILPDEAASGLEEKGISSVPLTRPDGGRTGYARIVYQGKNSEIVGLVTDLFQAGDFQVLIGTKSLLGEGYDAPCVNSLILASFVGSFVLCNQMRGRAIRVQSGAPEKTANIWHLVCVDEPAGGVILRRGAKAADLETLARRMDAFPGVSYDGKTIETGFERLGIRAESLTPAGIEAVNADTLARSARRDELRGQWRSATEKSWDLEMTDAFSESTSVIRSRASVRDIIGPLALFLAGDILILRLRHLFPGVPLLGSAFSPARWAIAAILTFFLVKYGYRLITRLSPVRYMRGVAEGLLRTLKKKGEITSECKVAAESQGTEQTVFLHGGTNREKELFAQCMEEFFAPVDNPRYLLRLPRDRAGVFRWFCVPDILAKRREDAALFAENIAGTVGKCELIYTRNPQGRQELLKARSAAWANVSRDLSDILRGKRKKRMDQSLV